ncbi:type 4a pilus biogenesis protein PilO [Legionella cardiaca]|uniref:Type 4a pilus biogenesis protein PilO n=1 Tax=Legionella cardiaca TaxID=1071983 RepID=A0ABY8AT39_9GAMM|nr:type 4a pilus biogenesis protein PilO [Legionella cardiaca]WED43835.1 type 4a pilus biogenesis protein PilO [Legionella cardiaca]
MIIKNKISLSNVEELAHWLTARKSLILLLISGLLISINYWLVIKPGKIKYKAFSTQESILRAEFEKKQDFVSKQEGYRKQVDILNSTFKKMLKLLPKSNEIYSLTEAIFNLGKKNDLTIELFAPLPEFKHEFYIELPIKVIVTGEYEKLALFLSDVAHLPFLITFEDFKITKLPIHDKESLSDLLLMKITIRVYRLRIA